MKVLVTGAGGMVGSHMVELLHDQGHDVLGTYYKPTTDIMEIDPSIRMEECDVRYYQAVQRVISKFQPDQRRVTQPYRGLIRKQRWKRI